MPRYFFDITDTDFNFRDSEGSDLAGPEAAKQEALETLADFVQDRLPESGKRSIVLEVRQDSGPPFLKAELSLKLEER